MLFNFALISSFLLAPAVLADRRREDRQSRFINRVDKSPSAISNSDFEYSTNWAGALWREGDGTFTSVTGTFVVPVPLGDTNSSASAWVGIDGDTCGTGAILQTGVDFTVTDGGVRYDAWYEWLPDYAYFFSDLDISAEDIIRLTVNASSSNSGTATVENLTNGQIGVQYLDSVHSLCGQNAEWIVEDYESNGNRVPFADFGTVTFTDAVATGTGTYTPSGATIVNIEQNGQVLTSASTDGSSVTITYV